MTALHEMSLGDVVADNPATARVFDQFGLDYCCHGEASLEDACTTAGVNLDDVRRALDAVELDGDIAWRDLSPAELADHIVGTHHAYLHAELPMLDALAAKVESVHAERHPELHDVRRLVAEVRSDLEPHLLKEERVLFPAIHMLAAGQHELPFGSIANPIRVMLTEHDRCGDLLAALRRSTGGYTVPADACASYRSLYERLEALELDTHRHIHKENHVLFPAVVAGRSI